MTFSRIVSFDSPASLSFKISSLKKVFNLRLIIDAVHQIKGNSKTDEYYAATPPWEAVKMLLSIAASQEGVETGLWNIIFTGVPRATIEELEDKELGYSKVTPLELLTHLADNAETVDCYKVTAKLRERDAPMDFEGEESLKIFFKRVNKAIKELHDEDIQTSMIHISSFSVP